jgi:hypothetical protein
VKFPKQVDVVIIGGNGQELNLDWSFDYDTAVKSSAKTVSAAGDAPGYYGSGSEYNLGSEYGVTSKVQTLKYNIWGSGNNITLGFRTDNSESPFSFQELNIQALMGRTL